MADEIVCHYARVVRERKFYSLIADEAADVIMKKKKRLIKFHITG